MRNRVDDISEEIVAEFLRATRKFGSFASAHEGLAVIWEEFEELKEEVWGNRGYDDSARQEAIQIAAMAMRYVHDVCSERFEGAEFVCDECGADDPDEHTLDCPHRKFVRATETSR